MNIFVTGATAGFGLAMSKKFVEDGHTVIATGRRIDRLKDLQSELGSKLIPLQLDVRNKDEVHEKIRKLDKSISEIDVLVNNAGLALGLEPAQKANIEDWNIMVDTNIKGVLNCTTAILPGMVERDRGHIVNIGSVAGEIPYPGGNVYGATKAFLHQFSLNLRADLLGSHVRVTNVEPGMCGDTEFSEVRFKGDKKKAESVYAGVKFLTSEDIAETVTWIISRPPHMNVNVVSLMPLAQSFSPTAIDRNMK